MKPHLRFYFLAAALLLAANALLSPAQAAPQKFVLDSSQSRLTLSGKAAGFVFTEQEAGSLTTSFSGNINLDLAEGTIQFTGASTIDARTNGVWQPGLGGGTGTALADFGAKANIGLGTAYTAARNFILDVTSPTLTLTNGGFDSRALIFSFPTNAHSVLDYNAGFAGSGSKALAGYSTNAVVNGASLTTSASGQKLVIQIDTTYLSTLLSAQDSLLHVTGKLVANGPPPALVIDSIIVTGANVTLQVQNGSSAAQLLGSTNMVDWFPVTATASTTGAVTTLTAPAGGPLEFFRVQK